MLHIFVKVFFKRLMNLPTDKKIILFDGVCNLCNSAINEVIKRDKKNNFVFTALTSETGQQIINHIKIDTNTVDSIILFEEGVAYDIKSSAALKIMNDFSGVWKLTHIFWLIPEATRNMIYDFIAKNRYKWFGKKESCMIPTPELKAKFID